MYSLEYTVGRKVGSEGLAAHEAVVSELITVTVERLELNIQETYSSSAVSEELFEAGKDELGESKGKQKESA